MAGLDLTIGISALLAAQRGLEVAGHNIANAATPGYSRQVLDLKAAEPESRGRTGQVGTGVRAAGVRRIADLFLDSRIRAAAAEAGAQSSAAGRLQEIEGLFLEPSENGLGARLSRFFAAASALSVDPHDAASRKVFSSAAKTLAEGFRSIAAALDLGRADIGREIAAKIDEANGLIKRVAELDRSIVDLSTRGERPNDLIDERARLLHDLSRLAGTKTTELPNGSVSVFLGGRLLVSLGRAETLEAAPDPAAGAVVRLSGSQEALEISSGEIGGLQSVARGALAGLEARLDRLARAVIFETNKLHSTGVPGKGPSETLVSAERAQDLDFSGDASDDVLARAGLSFPPKAGTIVLSVTELASGDTAETRIVFDPERQSLRDLASALSAAPHIRAQAGKDGSLRIDADSGYAFDFADRAGGDSDAGGILASLGIATLFSGHGARDMALSATVAADRGALAMGLGPEAGDGRNAIRLAALENAPLPDLDNETASAFLSETVAEIGEATRQTNALSETAEAVLGELDKRRESISGVSIEEEVASMIRFQRLFQSAARYLQVVDALGEELMRMIGQ
jgi:flagellar hook-associated protein 1 FlgK